MVERDELNITERHRDLIGRDTLAYFVKRLARLRYRKPTRKLEAEITALIHDVWCSERAFKRPGLAHPPIVVYLVGNHFEFRINPACECFYEAA